MLLVQAVYGRNRCSAAELFMWTPSTCGKRFARDRKCGHTMVTVHSLQARRRRVLFHTGGTPDDPRDFPLLAVWRPVVRALGA
jgi:hypothetical protein